ncbi:MAG TPA: ABC transporter ATP-binding protein [Burkholderiales bacterium]|nr:ABC transporter ATP-binding protein [Burkholderiales bacterium]
MADTLRTLWHVLASAERRRALLIAGLMVVGMALETLSTGLMLPAIALILQQDLSGRLPPLAQLQAALGSPSHAEIIAMVMIALVIVYLVKNAFLTFLIWRQTSFAYGVRLRLSQELFATYLRQPYTFHLQRNSAQLIRNIVGEVNLLTEALISGQGIATELLVLLGISCLLFAVEPLGAFIAVVLLGASAWVFYRGTRARVARWGAARQHHDGLRMQHLLQGLGGAKEIKLLGREAEFIEQYRTHNAESARVGQYQTTLLMMPRLWLEILAVLGLAALVLAMLAQGRDLNAIFPTLGLFAAAAFRLIPSINRVLAGVQVLRYSLPVVDTLREELALADERPAPGSPSGGRRDRQFASTLRLSDVSFAYPQSDAPAIRGASFEVRRGESVGFVGTSGSGKSTLVDVILGLLSPSAGSIEVDGRDIRQDLRAWQDQIGYVPQTLYLVDDTLRRNVAFGLPDAQVDPAAVERALHAAQLDAFVAELPDGLDTVVGERGVRLSGGQRQRIGIARALYHDPAVLVLDEATSALDAATERDVMQAVAALHGTKTMLIVAHRLSTIAGCDRLYRVEDGRVAEIAGAAGSSPNPAQAQGVAR